MNRIKKTRPQQYPSNPNVSFGDSSGAVDIKGRASQATNVDSTAGLRTKAWFVGAMPRKEVDIVICSKGAVGDWVVRESESQKGALVLVFRPVQPPGKNNVVLSKRIKFHDGMYCFENETKAYSSIELLVKQDPVAKRAAGDLFGKGVPKSSAGLQNLTHAHGMQQQQRRTRPPPQQQQQQQQQRDPRSSYVEGEDFGGFNEAAPKRPSMSKQKSKPPPAKEEFDDFGFDEEIENKPKRPLKKRESFKGFSSDEGVRVHIHPQTELTTRLGLVGTVTCVVQPNRKLMLKGGTLEAPLTWVLTHMRRYGRESESFYFEAGRRCAPNGPGMVHLKTDHCDAIFDQVDAHVRLARAELKKSNEEKSRVIQEAQARVRQADLEEEQKRKEAMAKHEKAAQAEAKKQIMEQRIREEKMAKEREEAERKAKEVHEKAAAARAEKLKLGTMKNVKESIYESVTEIMKNAEKLTISEGTEQRLMVKETKDKYAGMFTQAKTDEVQHSKIWLALNPQPLAYQSLADRREQDEEKSEIVVGGNRDYNMIRDMMTEQQAPETIQEEDDYPEDPFSDNIENSAGDLEEMSEEEEEDENYDPDAYEEGDLVNSDVQDTMSMLVKMREKRAEEERANKEALRLKFAAARKTEQEALDKELAIIAAKRAIEDAEKEKKKDAAVADAMQRMETELVFDFSFG